jgi:TRAP-type C4-dicarboxylate transport system substrate-binding protein
MGEALTQQSVDGVLLSWSGLSALGLEKLVTGHTQAPSGAPWPYAQLSLLLMNPDAYRGLTDDLRQVISANSGGDVSAAIGKTFDEAAMAARNNAAERGDTVNTLPESDLGNWRKAANTASAKRAADLDALGLKGEKLIKQARALIAKDDAAQ